MVDILIDSVKDCLLILPFLIVAYVLIEVIEGRSDRNKIISVLTGKYSAVAGSALGLVPQCGFSVMCARLYNDGLLSVATLVAVFISTSDEAILLLISSDKAIMILPLLIVKFAAGIALGLLAGAIFKTPLAAHHHCHCEDEDKHDDDTCHCACHSESKLKRYLVEPLLKSLWAFLIVFVVTTLFNILLYEIGDEKVFAFLSQNKLFEPLIVALFGLIPNCAASIIMTTLYIRGGIAFGSLIAGLAVSGGAGLIVLLKSKEHLKRNLLVMGYIVLGGAVLGSLVNLVMSII